VARFGIEEEFVLLDEETLVPLTIVDGMRQRVGQSSAGGRIMAEFLTSQFETVTDPLMTTEEAGTQLRALRARLGAQAGAERAIVAGTGTPFATTRMVSVSASPHYDVVAGQLAHITRGHEVNGLHVHVELDDVEERVRALNRVRGWLPVLSALTGNSPFVEGLSSRFASWRSILIRRLPASWCPPRMNDYEDYRAHVDQLLALGAYTEATSIGWAARISERYPTVEVRVSDAQLDADDTLFAAALTRAIVLSDDERVAPGEIDGIDASLWMAARHGMDARIVDPTTGEVADAWAVATRLLDVAHPVLQEHGDADFVADRLGYLRTDGTGAQRQERVYEQDGVAGLRALYRKGTSGAEG
jgi:carboxylate-amine ligase